MKTIRLMVLAVVAALATLVSSRCRAQETTDTIKVIDNPERVIVVKEGTTTTILAETKGENGKEVFNYEVNVDYSKVGDVDFDGPSWDIDFPFVKIGEDGVEKCCGRRPRGRLTCSGIVAGHVYMGQRFNYGDKSGIKNSFELGIRNLIGVKWSRGGYVPDFSIGLGYSMQRYSAQPGLVFGKEGSRIVLEPLGEGFGRRHTYLYIHTIQIPLMLTQPIGRDVQFMAGAVACFNYYAHAETEVQRDDFRLKAKYKGFQQRLLTGELVCGLGLFESVGVYASWSPVPLFQSPFGPGLKAWSIGVTIGF